VSPLELGLAVEKKAKPNSRGDAIEKSMEMRF
jgi:hypothetical protein